MFGPQDELALELHLGLHRDLLRGGQVRRRRLLGKLGHSRRRYRCRHQGLQCRVGLQDNPPLHRPLLQDGQPVTSSPVFLTSLCSLLLQLLSLIFTLLGLVKVD